MSGIVKMRTLFLAFLLPIVDAKSFLSHQSCTTENGRERLVGGDPLYELEEGACLDKHLGIYDGPVMTTCNADGISKTIEYGVPGDPRNCSGSPLRELLNDCESGRLLMCEERIFAVESSVRWYSDEACTAEIDTGIIRTFEGDKCSKELNGNGSLRVSCEAGEKVVTTFASDDCTGQGNKSMYGAVGECVPVDSSENSVPGAVATKLIGYGCSGWVAPAGAAVTAAPTAATMESQGDVTTEDPAAPAPAPATVSTADEGNVTKTAAPTRFLANVTGASTAAPKQVNKMLVAHSAHSVGQSPKFTAVLAIIAACELCNCFAYAW
jgi:hypothetical protein